MVEVIFIHPDGSRECFHSKPGDSVMDVALDNGVRGIQAQCGGGCTCCTCHCWVNQPWFDVLCEPHQDEVDMLEYAWGHAADSRLACQIKLQDNLQGITVRIPERQS